MIDPQVVLDQFEAEAAERTKAPENEAPSSSLNPWKDFNFFQVFKVHIAF